MDPEDRRCHSNLYLVRIPGKEGNCALIQFALILLKVFLELLEDYNLQIERADCTLGPLSSTWGVTKDCSIQAFEKHCKKKLL